MVPVLKKLKFWSLYLHIVAQVNHRGLRMKVDTNYLRDSNLIPRRSFLSTTFSIFINGVLKFMCVCLCSLVLSSKLSKCKLSKSILKVMTLVMPWVRDIFHLNHNLLPFLSYCASFAHLITLKTILILRVCIVIHVNYVKFERHAWPYPSCINWLLSTKCLILHIGLMMQSFLSLEILFLTLITPTLLIMYYIWL